MTKYVNTIPKSCIELKTIGGRNVKPDYYFFNPNSRVMYRRTRKSEKREESFAIMIGKTFQPRLIDGSKDKMPRMNMDVVKDILIRKYK